MGKKIKMISDIENWPSKNIHAPSWLLSLILQHCGHTNFYHYRVILELQKDRYFETLQSKYWNTTKKNNCPVLDDSEGITLQSLGGVFIATLVGLVIAMITLAFEVDTI